MTPSTIEPLSTARLHLEPLSVAHAPAMVEVLAAESLYTFTGGEPPTIEQLTNRYAAQAVGRSTDGSERWLNWIVTRRDNGATVGFVQATVTNAPTHTADIAWLTAVDQQGQGFATEATRAMMQWLRHQGVTHFAAYIHPEHAASMSVARRLGLQPTGIQSDGETRWQLGDLT